MNSALEYFKNLLPIPFRVVARSLIRQRRFLQIFERYRSYTMIDAASFCTNLELAESIKSLQGCIVECGVWRGGMAAGLATVLGPERRYYLFDSFEGLPPAKDIDGEAARNWQSNKSAPDYFENCAAEVQFAEAAMKLAEAHQCQMIKGWFNETLPGRTFDGGIALLRLDGDWYESTMTCLEHLYAQVIVGGLILIDDYYAWDGCAKAMHDFLSKTSSVDRIRSLNNVCYIVKR